MYRHTSVPVCDIEKETGDKEKDTDVKERNKNRDSLLSLLSVLLLWQRRSSVFLHKFITPLPPNMKKSIR